MHHNNGEITSPWSIPEKTRYRSVLPCAVKILLSLGMNIFIIIRMKLNGILSRSMALTNVKTLTRSYAFDMSCSKTQSSDLFDIASCFMLSKICMGSKVDLNGRPAKFDPFKILCWTKMEASLALRSLIKAFLGHSKSVIGLVLFKSNSQ